MIFLGMYGVMTIDRGLHPQLGLLICSSLTVSTQGLVGFYFAVNKVDWSPTSSPRSSPAGHGTTPRRFPGLIHQHFGCGEPTKSRHHDVVFMAE